MPVPSELSSQKAPRKIIKLTSSWAPWFLKRLNTDFQSHFFPRSAHVRERRLFVCALLHRGCLKASLEGTCLRQAAAMSHACTSQSHPGWCHLPRSTAGIQLVDGPLRVPDDLIRNSGRQTLLGVGEVGRSLVYFGPLWPYLSQALMFFTWVTQNVSAKRKKIAKVNGPFSCSCETLRAARSLWEDM